MVQINKGGSFLQVKTPKTHRLNYFLFKFGHTADFRPGPLKWNKYFWNPLLNHLYLIVSWAVAVFCQGKLAFPIYWTSNIMRHDQIPCKICRPEKWGILYHVRCSNAHYNYSMYPTFQTKIYCCMHKCLLCWMVTWPTSSSSFSHCVVMEIHGVNKARMALTTPRLPQHACTHRQVAMATVTKVTVPAVRASVRFHAQPI